MASGQAAGLGAIWARSSAEWLDDRAWRFSASDTTARATATAAYRFGAVTVTALMILSARCALMMLADLRHAASLPDRGDGGGGRAGAGSPSTVQAPWTAARA
jgi:hypothetical protein